MLEPLCDQIEIPLDAFSRCEVAVVEGLADEVLDVLEIMVENYGRELFFGTEVVRERALRDACLGNDVADARSDVALAEHDA